MIWRGCKKKLAREEQGKLCFRQSGRGKSIPGLLVLGGRQVQLWNEAEAATGGEGEEAGGHRFYFIYANRPLIMK